MTRSDFQKKTEPAEIQDVVDFATPAGSTRREFIEAFTAMGGAAAAAMVLNPGKASAADIPATNASVSMPEFEIKDYSDIPQRSHVYPASAEAEEIVKSSMTMDTLYSGIWPDQWSSPEAPEFHAEMALCKAAGFKVLAACPSADSLDASIQGVAGALIFYPNKISERPDL